MAHHPPSWLRRRLSARLADPERLLGSSEASEAAEKAAGRTAPNELRPLSTNRRRHLLAAVQLEGVPLGGVLTAAEMRHLVDAMVEESWEDGQMASAQPD